jgi:hypothetical protein
MSRRVRRLEKTVESLSQGLILALTELQDHRITELMQMAVMLTIPAWSMHYLQRFPAFLR